MANANIDALYVGSHKIKISPFFSKKFKFYKWCVTKVAHCIVIDCDQFKTCLILYTSIVTIYEFVVIFHVSAKKLYSLRQ